MKFTRVLLVLICLVFIFFIRLCFLGKNQATPVADRPNQSQAKDKRDLRIICGSPGITEIIFSLGLGDQVVGVSDFSNFPPEAKKKKRIGGLVNPNRERIISLKPDLLITQGKHETLARLCREHHIPFLSIKMDSLKDISEATLILGKKFQRDQLAHELVENLEAELEDMRKKLMNLPPQKIFFVLGHTPGDLVGLMTTGPGTFLHELIGMAGGINIFEDASSAYPQISKEALVLREPDIIIEVFSEGLSPENRLLLRQDWNRLAMLPAVKDDRIHFLTEDYLLMPSLRVIKTLKKLAKIIHPEAFE